VNKNTVPFEERSPFVTSGIRIGTPALTTRGMGIAEMEVIADMIHRVLEAKGEEGVVERVKGRVRSLCEQFPLYPDA
jgi:glycine hydroxymethyltransferase